MDTSTTVYDAYGHPIWVKDGNGFLTYMAYDQMTGAIIKKITDVDVTQTTTFANLPSGWTTPSGGGAHLTTTYPNGRIDYTVYNDANFEVRTYPAWDSTTNTPLLPITVCPLEGNLPSCRVWPEGGLGQKG